MKRLLQRYLRTIAICFCTMVITNGGNFALMAQSSGSRRQRMLSPVEKNGLWGFQDQHRRLRIPCKYIATGDFVEGRAAFNVGGMVSAGMEAYSIYHGNGNVVGGLWGFMDSLGRPIIAPQYQDVRWFSEGRAWVQGPPAQNGRWGIIDLQGNLLNGFFCTSPLLFHGGFAAGQLPPSHQWSIINREGNAIGSSPFDAVVLQAGGKAVVKKDKATYLLDCRQAKLIAGPLPEIESFHGERAIFHNVAGKWGMLDTLGNIVIPAQYDFLSYVHPPYVIFGQDGRYGYLDDAGRPRIDAIYAAADHFREGHAVVKMGAKYGILNADGSSFLPPIFDGITGFYDGFAWGCKGCSADDAPSHFPGMFTGGKAALINPRGELFPLSAELATALDRRRFALQGVLSEAEKQKIRKQLRGIKPISATAFMDSE